MKNKKVIKYISVIVLLLMVASCRTTEENYRGAYELAKQSEEKQDSLVANLIANEQAPRL